MPGKEADSYHQGKTLSTHRNGSKELIIGLINNSKILLQDNHHACRKGFAFVALYKYYLIAARLAIRLKQRGLHTV
ncbi:hypothetical protein A2982_00090 [candidate division WWE3 bacterium RIFCSPLOWO2_01_FULL_39_13]|uniref:Uncharacterized protein n=1 Tax=candidate division WWE3 bacterium RIFCSPLOWO2_01_FULL_39_13 TaxID=1802624 RepID=A0A1F4V4C3_UNCKA|nr:MAG: hypothetical protein A2982_00090 [candidate division WWE3 bacterium RIFCSPLOWO2_01_FULL_39_13]